MVEEQLSYHLRHFAIYIKRGWRALNIYGLCCWCDWEVLGSSTGEVGRMSRS